MAARSPLVPTSMTRSDPPSSLRRPEPRVSALGDESADDAEGRHEQRVEDVHDRRSQLVVADDAHEDGDGLRERVRDDRGERAVGER